MAELALHGNLETVGSTIAGWAFDLSNPDLTCVLDVEIDGHRRLSFVVGTIDRPDVNAVHTSLPAHRTRHGFQLDIDGLLDEREREICVRFNRGGTVLGTFRARQRKAGVTVYEGGDGYLFFKDDGNETLVNLCRACRSSDEERMRIAADLLLAQACVTAHGGCHATLIVPDRSVVLEQYVGSDFVVSPERPVQRLMQALRSRYGLSILYPIAQIEQVDPARRAPRTDSHLSPEALAACFQALGAACFPDRLVESVGRMDWGDTEEFIGDLGDLWDQKAETRRQLTFNNAGAIVFDTLSLFRPGSYTGSARYAFNPEASNGIAVIFGTSTSRQIAEFAQTCFRHVIHIWGHTFDGELIERLRPDVTVHVITERFVPGFTMQHARSLDHERIMAAFGALEATAASNVLPLRAAAHGTTFG